MELGYFYDMVICSCCNLETDFSQHVADEHQGHILSVHLMETNWRTYTLEKESDGYFHISLEVRTDLEAYSDIELDFAQKDAGASLDHGPRIWFLGDVVMASDNDHRVDPQT